MKEKVFMMLRKIRINCFGMNAMGKLGSKVWKQIENIAKQRKCTMLCLFSLVCYLCSIIPLHLVIIMLDLSKTWFICRAIVAPRKTFLSAALTRHGHDNLIYTSSQQNFA